MKAGREERLDANERDFYVDSKGKRIQEFAVLKVFHFIGARNKKNYMYKWARIKNGYWCAQHLVDASDSSYWLRAVADSDGAIGDTEVVQCLAEYRRPSEAIKAVSAPPSPGEQK